MKIIGLTGPTGAGKSVASAIFEKHGIPAINADEVYHALLESNEEMTSELISAFGPKVAPNSKIDRKRLAAAVFGQKNTPALLHTLNTITHKYVMAEMRELVQKIKQSGASAVLIDAPQLFEAHLDAECDLTVCVLAPQSARLERIVQRDGITEDAAQKRMDAQKSDDFFRRSCHFILINDGDLASLEAQILRFLENTGLGV